MLIQNRFIRKYNQFAIFLLTAIIPLQGCNKIVKIDDPNNTITTQKAFATDADATSAIVGIYNKLSKSANPTIFTNGALTLFPGLSADELQYFNNDATISPFETNSLLSTNTFVDISFWNAPYFSIYQSNSAIEGLQASSSISQNVKDQLMGEAKFIRAFCHFYLTNLFGDVPLLTTTSWAKTDTMHRTPTTTIFQQIIKDLQDAQNLLPKDYSSYNGERTRPTYYVATALLSRVYLYLQQWAKAEDLASIVINNNSSFILLSDLNKVFLANSTEAIWQLEVNNNLSPFATWEAYNIIPANHQSAPKYFMTSTLLNAFENDDKRRNFWVDSTIYLGSVYHYPSKYKIRVGSLGNVQEYYTLLRFAEIFLIRAEARAYQNKLGEAAEDINTIRHRAELAPIIVTTQSDLIKEIAQERKIELFAELGHRWFDLKRTNQASTVMSILKSPNWQDTDTLYPIPYSETIANPNLSQNKSY